MSARAAQKRVVLNGRTFIVLYDAGKPRAIKERKLKSGRLYDASYWHRSRSFQQGSIPDRVLVAAAA